MTILANADGSPWPSHDVSVPIAIGDVRGTTRNLGVSAVVFDSPVSFAVGTCISFVISMRGETQGPVLLECSGIVTQDGPGSDGGYQTAATIDTIRISGSP